MFVFNLRLYCAFLFLIYRLQRHAVFANINCKSHSFQVRGNIRNPWAHCRFSEWNETKFQDSFNIMKDVIKHLNLPPDEENRAIDQLSTWELSGTRNITSFKFLTPFKMKLILILHSENEMFQVDVGISYIFCPLINQYID